MPAARTSMEMQNRFGGLNLYNKPGDMPLIDGGGDVSDLTNCWTRNGTVYNRDGKQACFVTTLGSALYGGVEYIRSDGANVIVFVSGGKLYYARAGSAPLTYTEIKIQGASSYTSFSLSSANVQMWRQGQYLNVVDGVGAAYRVSIKPDIAISSASGSGPMTVTTSTVHGLYDGNPITISSITGTIPANGYYFAKVTGFSTTTFGVYTDAALTTALSGTGNITGGYVTNISASTVTGLTAPPVPTGVSLTSTTIDGMEGSLGAGGGTGSVPTGWGADYLPPAGTAVPLTASTNATPIVVQTTSAHSFSVNDIVYISGHATNTAANGLWQITAVADNTHFTIKYTDGTTNSVGNGVGSGGNAYLITSTTLGQACGATNLLPQTGSLISWSSPNSAAAGWTPVNVDGTIDLERFTLTGTDGATAYCIRMDDSGDAFETTGPIPNIKLVNDPTRYASDVFVSLEMGNTYTTDAIDITVSAYSDTAGTSLLASRVTTVVGKQPVRTAQLLPAIVSFGDISTPIKSWKVRYQGNKANHPGNNGPYIANFKFYPIVGNAGTSTVSPGAAFSVVGGHIGVDFSLPASMNMPKTSVYTGNMRITKAQVGSSPSAKTVTGAATASGTIRVTATSHGLVDGDIVVIQNVLGNTAANGVYYVTKHDNNSFDLYTDSARTTGVTTNGTYVSGGTAIKASTLDLSLSSHLALVIRPVSTYTGQQFQVGLTNPTGTTYTSILSVLDDGVTYVVDISTMTSVQRQNIGQVHVVCVTDIVMTVAAGAQFAIGPFTSAGNLSVGYEDYQYVLVEVQDTSLNTDGTSTGNTTDGTIISDASTTTTQKLKPTEIVAQSTMTMPSWSNTLANYRYVYRYGGTLSLNQPPIWYLVAKLPRWSDTITTDSIGQPYCNWNHTSGVFTDNTPDLALQATLDILQRGRGTPPTAATCGCGWKNRNILVKDSDLYFSWLMVADTAAGLYFNNAVDPTDPQALTKGVRLSVGGANDSDKIVAVVPYDHHLLVFKQKSVHVVMGDDPVSGYQQARVLTVGLIAPRGHAMFEDRVAFRSQDGVYLYRVGEPPVLLSQKVSPQLSPTQVSSTALDTTAQQLTAMVYNRQRLHAFAPVIGGTVNSVDWVYDSNPAIFHGGPIGWSKHTGYNITSAVSVTGASQSGDLYMFGADGQMYKANGNGDVSPLVSVTGASNATPIRITASGHGLTSGDRVFVSGVGGNTAANGNWWATVISSSAFDIYSDSARTTGVAGNGSYASGGACGKLNGIAATFKSGGLFQSSNDSGYWKSNVPARAWAKMTTGEALSVTATVTAVGCSAARTYTTTLNGTEQEMRFDVTREVKGSAIQVALAWTATTQTEVVAVGATSGAGTSRGNT